MRRGEKRHIFPFQENADVMFNSALAYELAVLKPFAEPLLRQVHHGTPEYIEAKRLLAFLEWFLPLESTLCRIIRSCGIFGWFDLEGFHGVEEQIISTVDHRQWTVDVRSSVCGPSSKSGTPMLITLLTSGYAATCSPTSPLGLP